MAAYRQTGQEIETYSRKLQRWTDLPSVDAVARVRTLSASAAGPWPAYVWSSIPGAALAIATAMGVVPQSMAIALFAISFVGLNLMHMGATWARVYVRPGWQQRPFERLTLPMMLAAFAVLFEAAGGGALLLGLQYFLSFHHALMQNYGLVRASQRQTRRNIDTRLDMAACLLLPGAALLYRAAAVCGTYSGAPVPAAPLALIEALGALGLIALLAFVWREWRDYRAGAAVDSIGIGVLCGTNLLWSGLLVGIPDPLTPLYALASGHYAQYLYFVWHVERREAPSASIAVGARLQTELRSSRLRYLAVLLLMAGGATLLLTFAAMGLREAALAAGLRTGAALDIPPWAAAMIGINLQHYWLDHRIWRTPRRAVAEAV